LKHRAVLAPLALLTACAAALCPAHATAASPAEDAGRELAVPTVATAPVLDGKLDDPAWAAALVLTLAYEVSPGENIPAPVRTTCYVTCDARRLYVAFDARDPDPAAVVADLADRDDAWQTDFVGFYLDTFLDHRRGYGFWVSAGGVQMDLVRDELAENHEDDTWDARWHSAAAVTDSGYCVEMAVPLAELRYPPSDGPHRWGFLAASAPAPPARSSPPCPRIGPTPAYSARRRCCAWTPHHGAGAT